MSAGIIGPPGIVPAALACPGILKYRSLHHSGKAICLEAPPILGPFDWDGNFFLVIPIGIPSIMTL